MKRSVGLIRQILVELEQLQLLLEVVDNELRNLYDREERLEGGPRGVLPPDNLNGGRYDPLPVSSSEVNDDDLPF